MSHSLEQKESRGCLILIQFILVKYLNRFRPVISIYLDAGLLCTPESFYSRPFELLLLCLQFVWLTALTLIAHRRIRLNVLRLLTFEDDDRQTMRLVGDLSSKIRVFYTKFSLLLSLPHFTIFCSNHHFNLIIPPNFSNPPH